MARQLPIEIFMPPNILKAKVGGTISGIDMAAIKRAEAAIEVLKTEFDSWLATDVARLVEGRDRFAVGPSPETRGALFRAAHDLKGEGETLDFPLIARVAASLTKLIDELGPDAELPLGLVDAHVAAIRVIFRDKIKSAADSTASLLADELEARVAETLGG
jgi:chemotaxis protein histidine kinase CheA